MKILGSDFDGTLTVGGIDEVKCGAIRAWRRAGNLFGLVSGRGPSYLYWLKEQYPDLEMDFLAAYNGAFIVDHEGKPLRTTACEDVSAYELTADLLSWGCPFVYVNGEKSYTVKKDGEPLGAGECHLSDLPREMSWFHQISIQLDTPADVAVMAEKICKAYGNRLNPLKNNICIDIVDSTVNKAYGLRCVAELFGGEESDVIAVGDNLNDLDMLEAFRSYAMENGVEEVKRVADQTVKTVIELIYRELARQDHQPKGDCTMKKLFISADIEGTCGITAWEETEANGGRNYDYFSRRMTAEVDAAARGAENAGYISTIKDAHDSARNIDPMGLPKTATLIRGWARDLYSMMGGLDQDDYDAVAFTGYHSEAFNVGNPLSHTMTGAIHRITLNGLPCPEFLINAYMAAYRNVPIVFLAGDEAICRFAKELIPGITTVTAKTGFGSAVISRHPEVVREEIFQGMKAALSKEDLSDCYLSLPEYFELVVEYGDWNTAHKYSFYPGATYVDAKTVKFESDDYYEVMRFMHFCV